MKRKALLQDLWQSFRKVKPAFAGTVAASDAGLPASRGMPAEVGRPRAARPAAYPWKDMLRQSVRLTGIVNLKKVAWGAFLVAVALFLCSLGYSWLGPRMFRLPNVASEKFREEDYALRTNPRPFEQYAQSAKQHKIFNALMSADADQAIIVSESNMVKDLTLLGIIGDADPQAIIEDKRSHSTYYVNKGKMIGDMQVADILQGKVIIQYGGERYELNL